MEKTHKKAPICVSNNMVLASYRADEVQNKIIGKLLERYSDVLSYTTDDLFKGEVETAPIIIDTDEYKITKERLMGKCEELVESVTIRFPFHLPNGQKGNVIAPILSKVVNREGTRNIELHINHAVIPELRYIGTSGNGKRIGMTRLPASINDLSKPYSWRIQELLSHMEQNYTVRNGWLPIMTLDEGHDMDFFGMLRIPDSYRAPNKLKARILDPALHDIFEKTGKEYTVMLTDAYGLPCEGTGKSNRRPVNIQFRLLYEKGRGSEDQRLDYIYRYMRQEDFDDATIDMTMYLFKDQELLNEAYEDLYAMEKNKMNRYKRKACFAKTLKQMGIKTL